MAAIAPASIPASFVVATPQDHLKALLMSVIRFIVIPSDSREVVINAACLFALIAAMDGLVTAASVVACVFILVTLCTVSGCNGWVIFVVAFFVAVNNTSPDTSSPVRAILQNTALYSFGATLCLFLFSCSVIYIEKYVNKQEEQQESTRQQQTDQVPSEPQSEIALPTAPSSLPSPSISVPAIALVFGTASPHTLLAFLERLVTTPEDPDMLKRINISQDEWNHLINVLIAKDRVDSLQQLHDHGYPIAEESIVFAITDNHVPALTWLARNNIRNTLPLASLCMLEQEQQTKSKPISW